MLQIVVVQVQTSQMCPFPKFRTDVLDQSFNFDFVPLNVRDLLLTLRLYTVNRLVIVVVVIIRVVVIVH